jgi:hypothetical protein
MACARKVFPEKVIAQVTVETAKIRGNEPVPGSMFLKDSMKRSRLKDSTVSFCVCQLARKNRVVVALVLALLFSNGVCYHSRLPQLVELTIEENLVRETDLLKGREVFKRHEGKLGTMVLVVRRPG